MDTIQVYTHIKLDKKIYRNHKMGWHLLPGDNNSFKKVFSNVTFIYHEDIMLLTVTFSATKLLYKKNYINLLWSSVFVTL